MSVGVPTFPQPAAQGQPRHARVPQRKKPQGKKWYQDTWSVRFIYLMWGVLLMDPHRWVAALGLPFFHRALTLLFIPLIAMMLYRMPALLGGRNPMVWYLPLLLYVAVAIAGVPFAVNRGVANTAARMVLLYYLVGLGTFYFINTPRRVVVILGIFLGQYVWWAFHANVMGVVVWHPDFGNSDGFGPLALIGLAVTFHFGRAAKSRKVRWLGYFLAAWCIVGIVASFARGVLLSMALLAGMMWLRSPRKGRMTLALFAGAAMIVIGAEFIVPTVNTGSEITERDRPHGGFMGLVDEVMSSFSEGTEEGTGNDRMELWKAAMIVFASHPLIGSGAQNVGIAAADLVQVGEIGSVYGDNPSRLWGRQLHNIYFQILSEFGLLGTSAFVAMMIDFWRKNSRLRRRDRVQFWEAVSGGGFNLYYVAIGLEMAMVAFLSTGFFYNTLYLYWMFAILFINRLLYLHSTPPRQPVVSRGEFRAAPVPA